MVCGVDLEGCAGREIRHGGGADGNVTDGLDMPVTVKWGNDALLFDLPSPDTTLEVIRLSIATHTHLPYDAFSLVHDGAVMTDNNATSTFSRFFLRFCLICLPQSLHTICTPIQSSPSSPQSLPLSRTLKTHKSLPSSPNCPRLTSPYVQPTPIFFHSSPLRHALLWKRSATVFQNSSCRLSYVWMPSYQSTTGRTQGPIASSLSMNSSLSSINSILHGLPQLMASYVKRFIIFNNQFNHSNRYPHEYLFKSCAPSCDQ